LAFIPGHNPKLRGYFRNHGVGMRIYTEQQGKSSVTYTEFEVQHRSSIAPSFEVTKQGFLKKIGTGLLGGQDIEVGDAAFDKIAIVKGHRESEIRGYFKSFDKKQVVRRLLGRYQRVTITGEKIVLSIPQRIMDKNRMVRILDELVDTSEVLAKVEPAKETVPPPLPQAPPQTKLEPPKPKPKPQPKREPEVKEITAPVEVSAPKEKTAPVAVKPKVKTAPVSVRAALTDAENERVNSIKSESQYYQLSELIVLSRLAPEDEELNHYQQSKRFAEEFAGREIDWKLNISRTSQPTTDRHFGVQPGVIGEAEIGGIQVVVRGVDLAAGNQRVRGELVKYDSFSQTLYIDAGAPESSARGYSSGIRITEIVPYASRI
ncbi:MAG: hypothetical protein AAF226_15910, partial [Verrucomicrobiota bacterium]